TAAACAWRAPRTRAAPSSSTSPSTAESEVSFPHSDDPDPHEPTRARPHPGVVARPVSPRRHAAARPRAGRERGRLVRAHGADRRAEARPGVPHPDGAEPEPDHLVHGGGAARDGRARRLAHPGTVQVHLVTWGAPKWPPPPPPPTLGAPPQNRGAPPTRPPAEHPRLFAPDARQ